MSFLKTAMLSSFLNLFLQCHCANSFSEKQYACTHFLKLVGLWLWRKFCEFQCLNEKHLCHFLSHPPAVRCQCLEGAYDTKQWEICMTCPQTTILTEISDLIWHKYGARYICHSKCELPSPTQTEVIPIKSCPTCRFMSKNKIFLIKEYCPRPYGLGRFILWQKRTRVSNWVWGHLGHSSKYKWCGVEKYSALE